jgi:hypothetical protein
LNPRRPAKGAAIFKTAPFDRSGTPPKSRVAVLGLRERGTEETQTIPREANMATRADPASGRSTADWRTRWAAPPRTAYTSETKPFFLTSEFLVFVLFLMGLGIATGTEESIDPRMFWILATVATSFYMLSRGIAKAGSRSRAYDVREDVDLGRRETRTP